MKWAVRRFYRTGKVPGPDAKNCGCHRYNIKDSQVSDSSLVAPCPPRVGKSQTCFGRDLNAKSHQGKRGSTHAYRWWPTGRVPESAGDPGSTWSLEKRWAATGCD